ncbi:hypothetical protein GCM10020219_001060 [Nonomuraea dietziae]
MRSVKRFGLAVVGVVPPTYAERGRVHDLAGGFGRLSQPETIRSRRDCRDRGGLWLSTNQS